MFCVFSAFSSINWSWVKNNKNFVSKSSHIIPNTSANALNLVSFGNDDIHPQPLNCACLIGKCLNRRLHLRLSIVLCFLQKEFISCSIVWIWLPWSWVKETQQFDVSFCYLYNETTTTNIISYNMMSGQIKRGVQAPLHILLVYTEGGGLATSS